MFYATVLLVILWVLGSLWWVSRLVSRDAAILEAAGRAVRHLRKTVEKTRWQSDGSFDDSEIRLELARIVDSLEHRGSRASKLIDLFAKNTINYSVNSIRVLEQLLEGERNATLSLLPRFVGRNRRHETVREEASTLTGRRPDAFEPSEAALLAGVTEKFFGSAAFKTLGLALVAAVVLAGSGVVLLGTQSVDLSAKLDTAAQKHQQLLTTTADSQEKSLIRQSKEAKDRIDDILKVIDRQQTQVNDQIARFTTQSAALQKEAIDKVMASVNSKLDALVATLATPLTDEAGKAKSDLERRIAETARTVEELTTATADTKNKADGVRDRLQVIFPLIDRIESTRGVGDEATALLTRLNTSVGEAERLRTRLDEVAKSADQQAKLVEAAIASMLRSADAARSQTDALNVNLGGARQTLSGLSREMENELTRARAAADQAVALRATAAAPTELEKNEIRRAVTDQTRSLEDAVNRIPAINTRLDGLERNVSELIGLVKIRAIRQEVKVPPRIAKNKRGYKNLPSGRRKKTS